MPLIPLFLIAFGATVIAYPEFIAYIIGSLFIIIGVNSLLLMFALRRSQNSEKKWSFGNYEIIRKR